MLPEDARAFLDFALSDGTTEIILRSSIDQDIRRVLNPLEETRTMTLWNRPILPNLRRQRVVTGTEEYFRIDDLLPTLEYSPCKLTQWNGTPGLLQGRIYGFSFGTNRDYQHWFYSLSSWIRRNFVKNPVQGLRGYVGPATMNWFRQGGLLLPMFLPPITKEWRDFMSAEHPKS
jgi:hypothetical protein